MISEDLPSMLQLSFGPISWLMMSEIFPLKLRGRGISIAVLVNFGTNALVTFAFSPLKVKILEPRNFQVLEVVAHLVLFFAGAVRSWSPVLRIRSDMCTISLFHILHCA